MNFEDITLPALALIAVTRLVVDGGDFLISAFTPPVVEGYGQAIESGHAGETITVEWSIIKRTNCPGQTSRTWNGPDGFYMTEPWRNATLPITLDFKTRSIPTRIPHEIPSGQTELTVNGYYQCGRKRIEFSFDPIPIQIIPLDAG